ncbi:MAG: PilT/PilU family type 4a pilus ATPase [Alphaproteobacteria bacterium]|nr:PilT/PilU family type 4a pilus ATPase [Alphaproteobacteria bacterium]
MEITTILHRAITMQASDIFIEANIPVKFKKDNLLCPLFNEVLNTEDTKQLIRQIYDIAKRDIATLLDRGDDDFAFSIANLSRFRVSMFKQRGSLACVIRIIAFKLPDFKELNIPEQLIALGDQTKGLILFTGPSGSGKSTTLACIIDYINHNHARHVITLEDPIEYLHAHNRSIITQREIGNDTDCYLTALRSSLRQCPDVILLGEMRDHETIETAITASETGHLVFSTLHTIGASNTINRIIDAFPANEQHQIAIMLSLTLNAVVSQHLIPDLNGKLIPVFEIMIVNPAIRNLIREKKIHQIDSIIETDKESMVTLDNSLLRLFQNNIISRETVIKYCKNNQYITQKIG